MGGVGNEVQQHIVQPVSRANQNYWKPTNTIRTRDIVRELPSQFTRQQFGENLMNAPKFNLGANSQSWLGRTGGSVASGMLNPFLSVRDYSKEAANQWEGVAPADTRKLIGLGGTAALDLAGMLSFGKVAPQMVRSAASKVAPKTMQQIAAEIAKQSWRGSKIAGKFGAGYGLTQSLTNKDNFLDTVQNTAAGYLGGRAIGLGLGFGMSAIPALRKAYIGSQAGKMFRTASKYPYFAETAKQVAKSIPLISKKLPSPGLIIKDVSGNPVASHEMTFPKSKNIQDETLQKQLYKEIGFTKTKIKGLIKNSPEFSKNPILTFKNGMLEFVGKSHKFKIKTEALGLDPSKMKPGMTVDVSDIKLHPGKVPVLNPLEKSQALQGGVIQEARKLTGGSQENIPYEAKRYFMGLQGKAAEKFEKTGKIPKAQQAFGGEFSISDDYELATGYAGDKGIVIEVKPRKGVEIGQSSMDEGLLHDISDIGEGEYLVGGNYAIIPKGIIERIGGKTIKGQGIGRAVEAGLPQNLAAEKFTTPKSQPLPQKALAPGEAPMYLPSAGYLASTPGQAKKLFNKTGEVPRMQFNQRPGNKPIILTEKTGLLDPEKSLNTVRQNLQTKFDNFEKGLYGSATSELKTGNKGATRWQQIARPARDLVNTKISKGLSSENSIIRNISRGIRGLMGGAGSTAERTVLQGEMRGGIAQSRGLANDFFTLGDEILPNDLSKQKVWAYLDPELSGVKVDSSHLSPQELKAVDILKEASDLINDQNFALGRITHKTWLQGREGRYITRAYTEYDMPPELAGTLKQAEGKLDLSGYMKRGEVTDWKQAEAIKNPFYLAAKRIQSTFSNKAITDYGNWIAKQPEMISNNAKAGYTQLSENPMWGSLSGKNIRHDVLADMRGFYSDSKILQGVFDGLTAYDRWKPRQILKKTKTVYNPGTRVGNQTVNRVFAFINGINPIAFEKNMAMFSKGELKSNGQYARLARKEGLLGVDMTKYELSRNLVKDGKKVGVLGKLDNKVADSYGFADDRAKISALKYWLDKGKSIPEAVAKVRSGFQDYSKVGQFYDIGAKLPIVGKPFIRFQSELVRILKNAAVENPLRLPILVGGIALMGELASKASGETAEQKKVRENRFGVPVIPFTNIPLVMQTPYGEVNIARMFGMYETAGADTKNKNIVQRVSKYLPVNIPTWSGDKTQVENMKDNVVAMNNDVVTSPVMSALFDTDFRGKSVADPNQTQYRPTTLTPGEQNINRAKSMAYGYNAPAINSAIGIGQAIEGKENQYQQLKTPGQAIASLSGFKMEQFGPKQVESTMAKEAQFSQYDKEDVRKQINAIRKEQDAGKIDSATAQKRVDYQIKRLQPVDKSIGTEILGKPVGASENTPDPRVRQNEKEIGGFSYTDSAGEYHTVKTRETAELNLAKQDFEESGKNSMKFGDKVLRRNADGNITVTSKIKYQSQLNSAKLSNKKRNDDFKGWMEVAEQQFNNLQTQLNDPSVDELDRVNIQDDIDMLVDSYLKYKKYGGFTKPKAGKKLKISKEKIKITMPKMPKLAAPEIVSPKIKLAGIKINLPKLTAITAKKPNFTKIKLKQSVSTIPGAKRLA